MPLRRRVKNMAWTRTQDSLTTVGGASTKVLLFGLTPSNAGIDLTIRRTLGLLHIRSDQVAATEDQIGAMGAILVSDDALAAGAASIPGPLTDIDDSGWFLWVPFSQNFVLLTGAGFDPRGGVNYPFDSKAQRIFPGDGRSVAFMIESNGESEGFIAQVTSSMLVSMRGVG